MGKPYNIGIIGGTGKVGRHIAAQAVKEGHQVRMLARNPAKVSVTHDSIEVVEGQVQNSENVRTLLEGCEIVINTFGQPTKEQPMYSKVTKDILEVMKDLNIRRYIGVSGGSLTLKDDRKNFINRIGSKLFKLFLPEMLEDKKLEWGILLENKNIEWTLIRLPFVKDSLQSKEIKINLIDMPGTKITNQDIADFIIKQIDNRKYVHKAPFISH